MSLKTKSFHAFSDIINFRLHIQCPLKTHRKYYEAARDVAAQLSVETLDFWEAMDHPDMFRDRSLNLCQKNDEV